MNQGDDLLVLYPASKEDAGLAYFERSMNQFGYASSRLGKDHFSFDWLSAAQWVVDEIARRLAGGKLKATDLVVFCDAYDLIFQTGPAAIVDAYRESAEAHQVVVSAEHGGGLGAPIPLFREFHNRPGVCGEHLVFVNTGFLVATASAMQTHCRRLIEVGGEPNMPNCDQTLTCHLMNRYPEDYILDTMARVCLTAQPETHCDLGFEVVGGELDCNQVTYRGRSPAALHFAAVNRPVQKKMFEKSVAHVLAPSDRRSSVSPSPDLMPKIFCIGMFKTGTTSLKAALQTLGFQTNGDYWVLFNGLRPLFDLTAVAFEPYHDTIYQRALQDQAFSDSPWLFLYEHLDRWFPGSRFVLTLRDAEAVATSDLNMWQRGTLAERWLAQTGEVPTREMFVERYEAHIARVRRYFAGKSNLLELDLTAESRPWERLCGFLELPVPAEPFPHENRGDYE